MVHNLLELLHFFLCRQHRRAVSLLHHLQGLSILSHSAFPERSCRVTKHFVRQLLLSLLHHFVQSTLYGFQLISLFLQLFNLLKQADMKFRIIPVSHLIARDFKIQLVLPVAEYVRFHIHLLRRI